VKVRGEIRVASSPRKIVLLAESRVKVKARPFGLPRSLSSGWAV
jgi:hypothetical protein